MKSTCMITVSAEMGNEAQRRQQEEKKKHIGQSAFVKALLLYFFPFPGTSTHKDNTYWFYTDSYSLISQANWSQS